MALRTIRKKSGRRKSRGVGAGGGEGGGESAEGGRDEEDDDEDSVGSVAVKIIRLHDVATWRNGRMLRIEATMIYARLSKEHLRKSIDILDYNI
ncbi:MAG: hypothetical protein LE180_06300 [Endomicrobium sp.]|uniref:hypothetical protein n=1 Tax=Candidatus Endomicrobiellum pyrsonymphae TaxID=1408203 RepID=UPI00357ACEE9|nr:hypothetical protein [Endomicrobium sp.]